MTGRAALWTGKVRGASPRINPNRRPRRNLCNDSIARPTIRRDRE